MRAGLPSIPMTWTQGDGSFVSKIQDMIESNDKEFWTNDAVDTGHSHHHVNTPNLKEVSTQIHNIINK